MKKDKFLSFVKELLGTKQMTTYAIQKEYYGYTSKHLRTKLKNYKKAGILESHEVWGHLTKSTYWRLSI